MNENNIAVLGPKDTYSDYAAQEYLKINPQISAKISYHKTIRKVFEDLSAGNSQIAVVPIENMSEGFIGMTLDALIDFAVKITEEIILPVKFSFLSKIEPSKIQKIYTHKVAEGQCAEFLDRFPNAEIIHCDSNIAAFEELKKYSDYAAAIVPIHIFEVHEKEYPFSQQNISDYQNNHTRFIVMRSEKHSPSQQCDKTSIIISDDSDYPGILKNIANAFASRGINMTSIISRPTKQMIGKYHFFIDIDGSVLNENVSDAVSEIAKNYPVKILGCYKSAKYE